MKKLNFVDLSFVKHYEEVRYYNDGLITERIEKAHGTNLDKLLLCPEFDEFILINFGNKYYNEFVKCKLRDITPCISPEDRYYHFIDTQFLEAFYQYCDFSEFELDEENDWCKFNYSIDDFNAKQERQKQLDNNMNKEIVVVANGKIILGTLKEADVITKIALIVDIDVFDKSEANGENEDK